MRLTVNDSHEVVVSSVGDAQPHWRTVRSQQFSEVWLDTGEDGPSLTMLVNGERAWLMYLRHHEDAGFSSRNPEYSGPPDALMEFVLVNGQGDEYPVAWTVSLEQALRACEYYISTQGGRSPDIVWHDDTTGGETQGA
jgi:immunity protein Imm1 of predicted polymorphic toxin system